jgi:hypothetical protein
VITLVCVLAYLTAALYGARHLYGRLRARAIDKAAAKTTVVGPLYPDPVAHFNEWGRGEAAVGSVLLAVFWPLALTGFGVYRFVTSNPALSRTELAAEQKRMAQRIRELEHELGIKEQT